MKENQALSPSNMENLKLILDRSASNPSLRMEAIRHLASIDEIDRAVYNSIDPHCGKEELECIRSCGVKSAVVLSFSTRHVFPKDRIDLLTGKENEPGLIEVAENAGIDNVLIDPGVIDLPSLSWTVQVIEEVKETLGYPCGCAPSNPSICGKRKRIYKHLFLRQPAQQ